MVQTRTRTHKSEAGRQNSGNKVGWSPFLANLVSSIDDSFQRPQQGFDTLSLNPDSAVATAAKSEEQTFHSEANRLVLLSGQRAAVVRLWIQIP